MRQQLEGMLQSGAVTSALEIADQYFMADPPASAEALWVSVIAMRAAAATKGWGRVLEWADTALSMKPCDQEALGWIQLHVGVACLYLGNVYRAEAALRSFQRIAVKQPSLQRILAFGYHNSAILMKFMKRHDEEINGFRKAAKAFEQIGYQKQKIQSELAIAWSYLLRGMPEPAHAQLQALKPDLDCCTDDEVHVDATLAWALYDSLHHNLDKSDMMCQELLNRDDVAARHRADIMWVLGCNARARGNLRLALTYADDAHHHAVQDYWPLQIERIENLRRMAIAN